MDADRVRSPVGELPVDAAGSPIGVVRMQPERSVRGVPELLQRAVNEDGTEAWEDTRTKPGYTYEKLGHALGALERETGFGERVRWELEQGKKLLFKPNIVHALAIDPATQGEGPGCVASSTWPFLAALMRWFHDHLDVSYHQMAVGEAGSAMVSFDAGVVAGLPRQAACLPLTLRR